MVLKLILRHRPTITRVLLATALLLFFWQFWDNGVAYVSPKKLPARPRPIDTTTSEGRRPHPIDKLIHDARLGYNQLLERQSATLEQAAQRYRERRGRHPPPGFDRWFEAATKSDAIVVEEFFDRIHHDINPLWGIEARQLRKKVQQQPFMIRVRKGKVTPDTESKDTPYRIEKWIELIKEMSPHIPDVDLVMNVMDESRVLVPFEVIDEYVKEGERLRRIVSPEEAVTEYGELVEKKTQEDSYEPEWIGGQMTTYWDYYVLACPPDSPARNVPALQSFNVPIEYPTEPNSRYTYKGYVQNYTAAQDPCYQPHLRGMHGSFIHSLSMSTTHDLLPMFAESKLPGNNGLLVPGAVYLEKGSGWGSAEGKKYGAGSTSFGGEWAKKKDAMVWRGGATGSRNMVDNWWHNHRSRFVQMLNGTTVAAMEQGDHQTQHTFTLQDKEVYNVPAQKESRLGAWLSRVADVGFTDMLCTPAESWHHWWYGTQWKKTCSWRNPWLSLVGSVSMKEQSEYKYLPDIDGNSFSGRYRAFLQSTSMPLKASIYPEWHDDRLIPWVHFVPLDISFIDLYGVMDYFLDSSGHGDQGHDAEAERIAMDGKVWAEAVLRREDMRLYVWRLLLEYARVMDDERERLAFVGDLR